MEGIENSVAKAAIEEIRACKDIEKAACERRYEAEMVLVKMSGFNLAEGSKTIPVGGKKVEFKQPVARSLDAPAWSAMRDEINSLTGGIVQPVKMVPTIDIKELRILMKDHPKAYLLFSQAVVAKPGKVGVTIRGDA